MAKRTIRGDMMADAVASGRTLKEVAKMFGVTPMSVLKAARRRGVKSTNKGGKRTL